MKLWDWASQACDYWGETSIMKRITKVVVGDVFGDI